LAPCRPAETEEGLVRAMHDFFQARCLGIQEGVLMEWAIEAKGLVKRYYTSERHDFLRRKRRVVEALRGVSFRAPWGRVFGLLGPNGAGKTTTVKILTTLLLPDDGEAFVAGYNVVDEAVEVRKRIGAVLSVERGFFWKLTGRENLRYFAMLRGLKGRELEERVEHVLKLVGLTELGAADKLYEEYSLGMKARLSLARALVHDPLVLILDEPTIGLDPPSARRIRRLVQSLAREHGKAVLLTTHNMFEAEIVCDTVAIISRGRIVAQGSPEELKSLVAKEVPIVVKFREQRGTGREAGELAALLSSKLGVRGVNVTEEGDGRFVARILAHSGEEEEVLSRSISILSSLGYVVVGVEVSKPSLEDVFIALTGGEEK
jgi:ABC-2 type transport system ATP-binding protein